MNQFFMSGFSDEIHEDLEIQLKSLQKLEIPYIEIRGVNGKSITFYKLEEVSSFYEQIKAHRIHVSALASPIGKIFITEPFDEHLELFKHTVDIAKLIKTQYIRMFSFYIPNHLYSDYKEEVVRRLKIFTKIAEENNIILLHENEKDIYGDSPKRCLELIQTINSPNFKITFDFANFIQCGYNPLDAYSLLKDEIIYFHMKDARFSDKQVVPVGLGDGDIKPILKKAIQNGYQGFLSLEPHLWEFVGQNELELNKKSNVILENKFYQFSNAYQALQKILNQLEESHE